MATLTKFDCFAADVGLKKHDLHSDTLKVYLTNATPSQSGNTVYDTPADLSTGGGYTAGGTDIQNTYSQSGGVGTLTGVDVTFTASGGTIGPFRYVVLYNDTAAAKNLIGFVDYGSAITLADGEPLLVDFGASVLTISWV